MIGCAAGSDREMTSGGSLIATAAGESPGSNLAQRRTGTSGDSRPAICSRDEKSGSIKPQKLSTENFQLGHEYISAAVSIFSAAGARRRNFSRESERRTKSETSK